MCHCFESVEGMSDDERAEVRAEHTDEELRAECTDEELELLGVAA
ncbi:hypothetical protein [Natronorarus salvus]